MIPLHDLLPTRRTPWATYALLVLNIAAYVWSVLRPEQVWRFVGEPGRVRVPGFDATVIQYGFVPCELARSCTADVVRDVALSGGGSADVAVPHVPVALTLLTAMFLHGGLVHLGGNMLFLWIFGNNVEDAMGRLRFLAFYLLGGGAASVAQVVVDHGSRVPNVGASGAIAAVLGAYLVLFPRARVLCLIPPMRLPAVIPLVLWIVLQLRAGAASLGGQIEVQGGGVAYWAHIGGFAVGMLLVGRFVRERRRWDGRTYVWA